MSMIENRDSLGSYLLGTLFEDEELEATQGYFNRVVGCCEPGARREGQQEVQRRVHRRVRGRLPQHGRV